MTEDKPSEDQPCEKNTEKESKEKNSKSRVSKLFDILEDGTRDENKEEIESLICKQLNELVADSPLLNYNLVFLYDDYDSIGDNHANQIYNAVSSFEKEKTSLWFVPKSQRSFGANDPHP